MRYRKDRHLPQVQFMVGEVYIEVVVTNEHCNPGARKVDLYNGYDLVMRQRYLLPVTITIGASNYLLICHFVLAFDCFTIPTISFYIPYMYT